MKFVIVGGSIGGLAAALLLRRRGADVQVIEKSSEAFKSRGSGISVQPPLVRYLQQYGLVEIDQLAVPMHALGHIDDRGRIVAKTRSRVVATSWGHLYRQLMAHLPETAASFGRRVISFDADANGVTVHLDDGEELRCDVLLGADGYQSTVRRQLLPQIAPVFAGYIAWRGILRADEISEAHHGLFEGMFSLFRPTDHGYFLGFFVPGADGSLAVGERRLTWAWLRNTTRAEHRQLTLDRFGRQLEVSMYEGGLLPSARQGLLDEAERRLPEVLVDLVRRTREPYFQGIVDAFAPRTVFGRALLLGDAACIVRPQTGSGALKAFHDAATLADALAGHGWDLTAALPGWERSQLAYANELVEAGREAAANSHLGWAFHG